MKSSPTSWWMVSLAALLCLWTHAARAQSCSKNEDCLKGFTCQAYQSGVCPASPPCQAGKECPAPAPCEVVTQHQCAPAACATDADCAEFMVCHASSVSDCPTAAPQPAVDCPPNQKCATPPPAIDAGSCMTVTSKQCVPRYQLPCAKDSDCGDGFACEAVEECSCSASGGSADAPTPSTDAGSASSSFAAPRPLPQDAGVATPPDKDGGSATCECHPSTTKSCRAKQIDCKSDTDCPSAFTCQTFGTGSASCMVSPDGGACVPGTETSESASYSRCEPRYYGGTVGVAKDGSSEGTLGGPVVAPTRSGDAGAPVPAIDVSQHSDAGGDPAAAGSSACSVRAVGAQPSPAATGYALGFVLLALGLRRRRPR